MSMSYSGVLIEGYTRVSTVIIELMTFSLW